MNRNTSSFDRCAIYICAFLIPLLMAGMFFALCGMYPFADGLLLTGDMNIEFVNFYSYFINTLHSNNDWSYMLTKTLGGDFPGLAAYLLHDPLIFILLLFPGDRIAAGIELVFALQISTAGLCASILLNNRYKRSWTSLLFSTAYAFSAFFFGYLVLTIYFSSLAILPLVLYFFLEYLDGKKSFVPFVITTCLYIFINYLMGFMLVIFLVILYVSRIIVDSSYVKKLPALAGLGVTVLLIDGYTLIRTGLSLLGEKTTEGADYGFYRRFPMNQLFAGLYGGCSRNEMRPLIYCSVAAFFFAVVYFVSKKYGIREKIANLFVIAAVAVSMWINTLDAVWHGFNNPEGFYWRYAYFISITLIVLGYKGFIDHSEKSVMISSAILYAYMAWLVISGNPYMDKERIVVNAVVIAVICAVTLLMAKVPKAGAAAFIILSVMSFSEMLYSSKTSYLCLNSDDDKLPSMTSFREDYHDIKDVVSYVKDSDSGFYRIEKDFDRAVNDPSMFDYIGLSHDSSCEKDELIDWLVNFGFCKTVYYTYYNGGSTTFVDDLFGVKYFISRFDGMEKPYDIMPYSGKYYAYKNEDALPLAYIAPDGLVSEDIKEGNTFEKQNTLISYWSDTPAYLKADPVISLDGAEDAGGGKYVRTDDEGYVVYTINITEKKPLYFYFYAPGRQDGEVFVNGQSRDVYFTVNHWNTLCAGTYDIGETLEIRMKILGDELVIDDACFYYEDADALHKWAKEAAALNEQIGDVTKIKSSHLTFDTNCTGTGTVIVSIPYESAWTVKCDGQRIDTQPAIGQLMSFTVPEGQHVIDMKYTPAGTASGIAASSAGIVIFLIIIILPKEMTKRGQKLLKRSKIHK